MAHWRIILAAIVALLLIVVVLQNTEPAETQVLFMTISMPRAVLLFVTLAIGFVLGLLSAAGLARRRTSAKKRTP
jgi:putative membrane protein